MLSNCFECEHKVSTEALACPACKLPDPTNVDLHRQAEERAREEVAAVARLKIEMQERLELAKATAKCSECAHELSRKLTQEGGACPSCGHPIEAKEATEEPALPTVVRCRRCGVETTNTFGLVDHKHEDLHVCRALKRNHAPPPKTWPWRRIGIAALSLTIVVGAVLVFWLSQGSLGSKCYLDSECQDGLTCMHYKCTVAGPCSTSNETQFSYDEKGRQTEVNYETLKILYRYVDDDKTVVSEVFHENFSRVSLSDDKWSLKSRTYVFLDEDGRSQHGEGQDFSLLTTWKTEYRWTDECPGNPTEIIKTQHSDEEHSAGPEISRTRFECDEEGRLVRVLKDDKLTMTFNYDEDTVTTKFGLAEEGKSRTTVKKLHPLGHVLSSHTVDKKGESTDETTYDYSCWPQLAGE